MNEQKELTGDLLLKLLFYDDNNVAQEAIRKAADEIFESDTPILSVDRLAKKYLTKGRFLYLFYERLNQRLSQEKDDKYNRRVFDFYKVANQHKPDLNFITGYIICAFDSVSSSKRHEWLAYLKDLKIRKDDYETYAKQLFECVSVYPELWDEIINRIPKRKNECIYLSGIFETCDSGDLLVEAFNADRKKFMLWSQKAVPVSYEPGYLWGMVVDHLWDEDSQEEIENFLVELIKSMSKIKPKGCNTYDADKIWDKLSNPRIKLYEKLSDKAKVELVENLLACSFINNSKFVDLIDLLNRVRDPKLMPKAFLLAKRIVSQLPDTAEINIMPLLMAAQRYLSLSKEGTADPNEIAGLMLCRAFMEAEINNTSSVRLLFKIIQKTAALESEKTTTVIPDLFNELLLMRLSQNESPEIKRGQDIFLAELFNFLHEMPAYQQIFINASAEIIKKGSAAPAFIEEIIKIKESDKNYPLVSKLLKLPVIKNREKKAEKKRKEAKYYLSLLK